MLQPQFTGAVPAVIPGMFSWTERWIWVVLWGSCGSGSSVWLCLLQHSSGIRAGCGSLCISAHTTPSDQINGERQKGMCKDLLALHSPAGRSQGAEQEHIRAGFAPFCLLQPWRLSLCPQELLTAWHLAELCGQGIWALLHCCSSLLYWSPEHLTSSPYQCIAHRHRSPQAAAVRMNQLSFQAFPDILWESRRCSSVLVSLVVLGTCGLFPLSSLCF